jgi:NAD(P)-dependent dehydrogenase (short-subunit alcohol dehydrogenase family)
VVLGPIVKPAGKVIVVTGAGSGMGREVALELLRRGARVAAADVNETTLRETARLAKAGDDSIATFAVNVTDKAAVEALPQTVVAHFGAVDAIINCAGIIQPFVPLNDLDYASIDAKLLDRLYRLSPRRATAFIANQMKDLLAPARTRR